MFTRKRLPPLQLTADWAKDGPRLTKWLNDYLLELEQKNALTISQAQIYVDQGLQFPAAQVVSTDPNNLDDYEEGVWTPVLTFAAPGDLSVAYSLQKGFYTKIGRTVVLEFALTTSTFTFTTASGNCNITGLPFPAGADVGYFATGAFMWQGITKAGYTYVVPQIAAGASLMIPVANGSGQPFAFVTAADMPSAGSVAFRGAIVYHV